MENTLDLKDAKAGQVAPVVDEVLDTPEAVPDQALEFPQSISWQAHHVLSSRARFRHYLAIGGFFIAGSAVSLWQSSIMTFLVIAFGLIAWEVRERFGKPANVAIDARGLWVDGQHYEHAQLASFDVHRMQDDTTEVSVKTSRRHLPYLRLPLGDQDPRRVHAVLSQFVPYAHHKIPLLDWWLRK